MREKNKTDVFSKVEYFHIVKNKKTLLQLEGEEINGLKLSDVQKIIGEKLGEGTYNYVCKYENNATPKRAQIRGFIKGKEAKPIVEEDNKLVKRLEQLEKLIDSKSNSPDVTQLLELRAQTYQIQIGYYKDLLDDARAEIKRLKEQLESDGGNNLVDVVLPMLQTFLSKKAG